MSPETKAKILNFFLERVAALLPLFILSAWTAGVLLTPGSHLILIFGAPAAVLALSMVVIGRPVVTELDPDGTKIKVMTDTDGLSLPSMQRLRLYRSLQLGRDLAMISACLVLGQYIWFAIFLAVVVYFDVRPLFALDIVIEETKKKLEREATSSDDV